MFSSKSISVLQRFLPTFLGGGCIVYFIHKYTFHSLSSPWYNIKSLRVNAYIDYTTHWPRENRPCLRLRAQLRLWAVKYWYLSFETINCSKIWREYFEVHVFVYLPTSFERIWAVFATFSIDRKLTMDLLSPFGVLNAFDVIFIATDKFYVDSEFCRWNAELWLG